jgi:hypothetical protein
MKKQVYRIGLLLTLLTSVSYAKETLPKPENTGIVVSLPIPVVNGDDFTQLPIPISEANCEEGLVPLHEKDGTFKVDCDGEIICVKDEVNFNELYVLNPYGCYELVR